MTRHKVTASQSDVKASQSDVKASQSDVKASQSDVKASQSDVEELVQEVEDLSGAELRELVRRVPRLREAVEAVERGQLAEARLAYQVERTQGPGEPKVREVPTPEERRAMRRHQVTREELAARYKNPVQWTEHPWVVRVKGYQGGEPIILGTRIPVRVIAIAWIRHGMPIWEVLENWDVHEAQVYDALSYYYDH